MNTILDFRHYRLLGYAWYHKKNLKIAFSPPVGALILELFQRS